MLSFDSLGGAGGFSSTSSASARSGPNTSGAGSVNVGGFNPPPLPGQLSGAQMVMIAAVVMVGLTFLRKR